MDSIDPIWNFIKKEALQLSSEEPLLADFFTEQYSNILVLSRLLAMFYLKLLLITL